MMVRWLKEAKAAGIPRGYRQRVGERLAVLAYAQEHSIRAASLRFGLDRKTVRAWKTRCRTGGIRGLIPRYPAHRPKRIPPHVVGLVTYAREKLNYGSTRTQLWLLRAHQIRISQSSVQRIVREHRLPPLRRVRKRRPRQLHLFERDRPGDCVQLDVKFVRVAGQRRYQYTALDDCTRYRVLRLYRHLNQWTSQRFLAEVIAGLPFPIRCIQTDNGREFPLAFKFAVEAAGIEHRYIRPRRPQQNGKVERSHRIDAEEFWSLRTFAGFSDADAGIRTWERTYNEERFSLALHGRTPAERLADFRHAA